MKDNSRRTILVIDDEKPFCDAVRDYFEDDRIEVLTAQSGADGLKICGGRKVDVILLDQKLPDGEGHALAPRILAMNEQAKIIFAKIKNLVEAAGGTTDDVVKVTIYVVNIKQNTEVWRARQEFFKGDFPASTLVQVAALGTPEMLVEIEAVAHIGGK